MYDLSEVGHIERVVVGSKNPEKLNSEEEIQAAADFLNRCLSETPKGKIVGVEKTFNLLNIGEHQVVLQCMIYHVGFPRKPVWLSREHAAMAHRANGAGPTQRVNTAHGATQTKQADRAKRADQAKRTGRSKKSSRAEAASGAH